MVFISFFQEYEDINSSPPSWQTPFLPEVYQAASYCWSDISKIYKAVFYRLLCARTWPYILAIKSCCSPVWSVSGFC